MAEGATLRSEHFPVENRGLTASPRPGQGGVRERLAEVERSTIEAALVAEGGNQTRAAERLGMPRRTLVHKLTQYRRAQTPHGEHDDE
jgi:DNA-binding NtrC family response regulator